MLEIKRIIKHQQHVKSTHMIEVQEHGLCIYKPKYL